MPGADSHISSAANPLLKTVARAIRRRGRTADGLVVAESPHLLREARESPSTVELVLVAEDADERIRREAENGEGELRTVVPELFRKVSSVETSQGVLTLVRLPGWTFEHLLRGADRIVILDGVRDPGNAGAIARSAEAFGAGGIVFLEGSASPFHPKTLRASAGSLFRLPFLAGTHLERTLADCRAHRLRLLAASAHEGDPIAQTDFAQAAIAIGSEAHGVSPALGAASQAIRIPIKRVESLNAAMAAAVILYEASRRDSG